MSIYGLILAGGQSARMKTDKRKISYHGKDQLTYTYDLLKSRLDNVYISLNTSDKNDLPTIVDKANRGGPMNGLISAFEYNKHVAWLIMAIDMPLVEKKHIDLLMINRDKSKVATSFLDKRELPYPLFTIYESSAYSILQNCGHDSLLKFLKENEIEKIITQEKSFLTNVNTQKEAQNLKALLKRIGNNIP